MDGNIKMGILEEVEKRHKEVYTDSYTTLWRDILNQYKDGALKIDPDYQRLFRWSIDQQTQFIESLLLGLPSPALFFAENKDGTFEILDGLQRFSTVLKFFANEHFKVDFKAELTEEEINRLDVPTVLVNGPILKDLDGYTAKSLPETLQRTIKNARVTVILLKKESDILARYEVFRRLNRYGAHLSDQEIRNVVGRLHGKEFPEKLRAISSAPEIIESLSLAENIEKGMGVDEMILRLLASYYKSDLFKHEIVEFLDQVMILGSQGKFQIDNNIEDRLKKTFKLINDAIPDGKAFRFPRTGFSTNLFDVVATGVFHNCTAMDSQTLVEKHRSLMVSQDLKNVTGGGSNSKKKYLGRLDLGKTWFGK